MMKDGDERLLKLDMMMEFLYGVRVFEWVMIDVREEQIKKNVKIII